MMHKILTLPHKVLRKTAIEVPEGEFGADGPLPVLISEMFQTMTTNGGIGLAAPQIGISKRIFITRVEYPRVFVNPKIVPEGIEKVSDWEGCLSFPGVQKRVSRWAKVWVTTRDPLGGKHHFALTGLDARAAQHELDHLNGVLFIDIAEDKP